jgi:hypothetical protein
MEKKIRYKLFRQWQDDKEEAWLEEMSASGWHLVGFKGIAAYEFVAGPPAQFSYRLDYQDIRKQQADDYKALFADAGWEHLGEKHGWHYFRKPQPADHPEEIFTDTSSKIAKYKRVLATQVMMLAVYFTLWMVMPKDTGRWFDLVIPGLFILLLAVFAVGYFKVAQRIKELEQTHSMIGNE